MFSSPMLAMSQAVLAANPSNSPASAIGACRCCRFADRSPQMPNAMLAIPTSPPSKTPARASHEGNLLTSFRHRFRRHFRCAQLQPLALSKRVLLHALAFQSRQLSAVTACAALAKHSFVQMMQRAPLTVKRLLLVAVQHFLRPVRLVQRTKTVR